MAEIDPLTPAIAPDIAANEQDPVITSEAFDRLYRPEALDVPVMVARDGPIASIDPDSVGTLAPSRQPDLAANAPATPDNLPFAVPGRVDDLRSVALEDADALLPPIQVVADATPSVSLLAVRPSWVRVTSVDGTVVFEKILDAGERFDVPLTEEPATLRAGNAGSLYFEVNGKAYGPAGNGPEVIKNVALEPSDLTGNYQIADIQRDSDLARFVAVAEAASE
ncbi:MAG: DUF4115 domain-containing protein [Boseongicola sp.]|nr:DUF4115 domain-containing protein [Boseongicola sp.]